MPKTRRLIGFVLYICIAHHNFTKKQNYGDVILALMTRILKKSISIINHIHLAVHNIVFLQQEIEQLWPTSGPCNSDRTGARARTKHC